MTNTIALAEKFMAILDEIYGKSSVTAVLDAKTKPIDHGGAATVQIYKTTMVGLGTYSRSGGFPKGDVTGAWEDLLLTQERGREFSIDRQDNDETLGEAFGTLGGEFVRTQVVPEVDAYRFGVYAGWSGIQTVAGATLSSSTILAAIDEASGALDDYDVPEEGRILYISSKCNRMLQAAITRMLSTENSADRRLKKLDEMTIIPVPQSRFYTAIDLDAGATSSAGGYSKTSSTGKDINFMLLHNSAVLQATKQAKMKVFDPDTNQDLDAWKIQYRLYHDAFVYDNKVKAIYLHKKA